MRYVFAAILSCALGAPTAFALPAMSAAPTISASNAIVTVAKRGAASGAKVAKAKSKKQDNGIHPLVGSGDY